MTVTTEGERLRYADLAHTRLLMDADVSHLLSRTGYDELRGVAERHKTLDVPQVRGALAALRNATTKS